MPQDIRVFIYNEDPQDNLQVVVTMTDEPTIVFRLEAIEKDRPFNSGAFAGPNDGIADGELLLPEYCLVNSQGERYGSSRKLVARDAVPYAAMIDTENSPLCTAPTDCNLDFEFDYSNPGFVGIKNIVTEYPPWKSSRDNVTFNANQTSFPAAPGSSGRIYLADAGPCARAKDYLVPGGSTGGNNGEVIDEFEYLGEVAKSYYDVTTKAISFTQTPNIATFPSPLSEEQRGRTEGELLDKTRCENTTEVRFYAMLVPPYVRRETTANSTECGFVPEGSRPTIRAVGHAPTSASGNGHITATPQGGTQPLTLELLGTSRTFPAIANQAKDIPGVAPGTYEVEVRDGYTPVRTAKVTVTVPAFVEPVAGCMDEDANNYNPLATVSNPDACRYTPRWVGVWSPEGVPVVVRPATLPAPAYLAANLYAGFPVGHSLADVRPLVYIATVRATVNPRGLATFDLAPYLQAEMGALQDDGSRRLDLNSFTAQTNDLYVGFRLELEGKGIASGYAVNSVLREQELEDIRVGEDPLWPFGVTFPVWPGFDYLLTKLNSDRTNRLGELQTTPPESGADEGRIIYMKCPSNPLPVAWLSPEGGFGYWVFSGNHSYGDEVGEGAPYTEAGTHELRYSSRAPSRETIEASTGLYSDRALVEGLRTLRRGVQAWYQPGGPGTTWIPVFLKGGTFPAYREGRRRYEATVQFTEARPQYVQGQ